MVLLIYYKRVMRDLVFWIILFRLLRVFVLIFFFKTSVFRIAHVSIRGSLGIRSNHNIFGLSLFTFFDIRSLNRKVSALFTFSLVLFTCRVYLSNDFSVQIKILLAFIKIVVLIFSDSYVKHSVLNVYIVTNTYPYI